MCGNWSPSQNLCKILSHLCKSVLGKILIKYISLVCMSMVCHTEVGHLCKIQQVAVSIDHLHVSKLMFNHSLVPSITDQSHSLFIRKILMYTCPRSSMHVHASHRMGWVCRDVALTCILEPCSKDSTRHNHPSQKIQANCPTNSWNWCNVRKCIL